MNMNQGFLGWRTFKHLSVLDLIEFLRKDGLLDHERARIRVLDWCNIHYA